MMQGKLLQTAHRPATIDVIEDAGAYYAHALALLLLLLLWKLPNAKPNPKPNNESLEFHAGISPSKGSGKPLKQSSLANEQDLENLLDLYPTSIASERIRFLVATKGDFEAAAKQLGAYLEWRERHDNIENSLQDAIIHTDADDWNRAVNVALCAAGDEFVALPRVARMYMQDGSQVCDRDGYRVIHVMPGQMDFKLADPKIYAAAIALYLDRKLDRQSPEICTVLLDVRGGVGWPNIPPHRQLPFIKSAVKQLASMFPERMFQCLLYPLPPAALWIWNLVKVCMDPATASKIQPLSGCARIESPMPFRQLERFLDLDVVHLLDTERKAAFKVDSQ